MDDKVKYIFHTVHMRCSCGKFKNYSEVAAELRRIKIPLFKQDDNNPSIITEKKGWQKYRWRKHHISTALLLAYLNLGLPIPKQHYSIDG